MTKCATNQVGFSKFCICLNVAQNLATTVVVEAENDEETFSTDGTVCTIFLCNDRFQGKYISNQIYIQSFGVNHS